ncbi:octopamine receptor beta-2R-like [Oculina patagonica]
MGLTEENTERSSQAIMQTVIFALTTMLSLSGNSLVCLAFYRNRRLRTTTNFLVLSLAVSDIMVATFVFPFGTVASELRRWPLSDRFCQFNGFLSLYWAEVSLSIIALTSINRYLCVVKPQRYAVLFTKRKTIMFIVSFWICPFILSLAYTLATPVIYHWQANSLYCLPKFLDEQSERILNIMFACLSLLAMSLVIFGYSRVYCVVRRHNAAVVPSLQATNSQGTISPQEIKTSRVLFAAVFGFFVCWTPFIVVSILQFGFQVKISSSTVFIHLLFSTFSAFTNPVIYGVMNRAMQKEFRNILLCKKRLENNDVSGVVDTRPMNNYVDTYRPNCMKTR